MLAHTSAKLCLNGKVVGHITIRGFSDSWGYGEFAPNDTFGEFATLFGQWSLLMHADDGERQITHATSEELRHTERALDSLRAKLIVSDRRDPLPIAQVNIDGSLIEWKVVERLPASSHLRTTADPLPPLPPQPPGASA